MFQATREIKKQAERYTQQKKRREEASKAREDMERRYKVSKELVSFAGFKVIAEKKDFRKMKNMKKIELKLRRERVKEAEDEVVRLSERLATTRVNLEAKEDAYRAILSEEKRGRSELDVVR